MPPHEPGVVGGKLSKAENEAKKSEQGANAGRPQDNLSPRFTFDPKRREVHPVRNRGKPCQGTTGPRCHDFDVARFLRYIEFGVRIVIDDHFLHR